MSRVPVSANSILVVLDEFCGKKQRSVTPLDSRGRLSPRGL